MDKSNLIDFDSTNVESYSKLASPLIPNPVESGDKYMPVLYDAEYNNPFDKVLRNITNNDDPFERVYETAYAAPSNSHLVENEKENYVHLVSPIQTPQRKKSKMLTKTPLFLDKSVSETTQKSLDVSINLLHQSVNESDASLQCLSETFMNDFDGSFGVPLESPLLDTANEQDTINKSSHFSNLSQNINNNLTIPSIYIYNENKHEPSDSSSGILNQAFLHSKSIENSRMMKLSSKSSIDSHLYSMDSLGTSELSNINRISSSYQDTCSDFDRAFVENKSDSSTNTNMYTFNNQRKCLSAQKPPRKEQNLLFPDKTKFISLNNSFSGFNLNNRKPSSNSLDDSVFLEARNLAHAFHSLANDTSELDDISEFPAPWMTDDIDLCDRDSEDMETIVVPTQNEVVLPKSEVSIDEEKLDAKDDAELKNSSNLLHTLREFMKCDGNNVDERKLEENLLNSLTKALRLNTSGSNTTEECPQENDVGDNGILDNIQSSGEVKNDVKCVNVKVVPKLKTQSIRLSTAPVKNLKVKNEKITTAKGPLKAVIPLTNMAKTRRSVAPIVVIDNTTPSKCSQKTLTVSQIKRTSTPNEPKIKPPIAQSTPDASKINNHDTDSSTPVKKRSFIYSLSPLARPASTTDLSGESNLNKSLSPRNISDSMPCNLNKSGSLVKHGSNSSIPTMKSNTSLYRRNSVGEKPDKSVLNRSYENNKPARSSLLKRSSSFQSKSTTQSSKTITDNNNVIKRFVPGMKLKLSNLGKKKSCGD